MSTKFTYLYLAGGIIAIGLFIFDLVSITAPKMTTSSWVLDVGPIILFLYLCFKSYHEKKDKELM
jgi:hypothetical protein